MRKKLLPPRSTLVLLAAAIVASTGASAQEKPRQKRSPVVRQYADAAPPITVTRRSFLDPGPVVPVGSLSNYMAASTFLSRTEDQTFARSYFGNEALPAPFEIPARPQPLVTLPLEE